jgi:ribosomal protein L18
MFSLKRKKSLFRIRKKSKLKYELSIFKSSRNMNAFLYDTEERRVISSCSTKNKLLLSNISANGFNTSSEKSAFLLGQHFADIIASNIPGQKIYFNRSCYPYIGRIKSFHEGFVSKYK